MDHRFEIHLVGGGSGQARLEASLFREVLDFLVQGAQGALRLRVEGRSRASGPVPGWLELAARVEVTGLAAGSTSILIESPAVRDVAPVGLGQMELFHAFSPDVSALHLLAESLHVATAGEADSELYDGPLLKRFGALRRVMESGIDRIEIRGDGECRAAVEPAHLERVHRLIGSTPPTQRVRVAGHLDTIRHRDRMFVLVLADASSLKGVAEGIPPGQLAEQFGKPVVMSGSGVFRPSGKILRIEADLVESADEEDLAVWSHSPRPTFAEVEVGLPMARQGSRTGLGAILGEWPGDESDEEFAAAIAELS